MRAFSRRAVATIAAVIVVGSAFLGLGPTAEAHSGGAIDSFWATTVPAIDGAMTPSEWADAEIVDLGAIPGNRLPAFLLVKNNESFLWVAYDAVGDTTSDANDSASFAFDTGHDGVRTNGAEDQFAILGGTTAHLVFANGSWTFHESPIDPGLPDHAGLAASKGFGPSDRNATDHRIFEFQIPLVLIGVAPGDTIGLFGGSQPAPGVVDYGTFVYSTWPDFVGGPSPLSGYGDLSLDTPPGPIGVSISPPSATAIGRATETMRYDLTVRNRGTSAADTFDIAYVSAWPASVWDASGNAPLADTDADGVPDTGNVSSGGSVVIVVKVSIPANTSGCSSTIVVATSSQNTSIADSSNLTTCTSAASFQPPHADFGVDTDVPPNGFFDLLEIDAVVQVTIVGSYSMEGTLYNGNESVPIDRKFGFYSLNSGVQTLPLMFSGKAIFRSGLDGPFSIRLVLFDGAQAVLDNDTHTTRPYNVTDFDPLAAVFDPPHRDFGRDTDSPPNGLYDELVVETGLKVNQAGDFDISAGLYDDQFSRYVTGAFERFSLSQGVARVEIAFSGTEINQSRTDGPYQVLLSLYAAPRSEFLDSDSHVTAAYRAAQFDPPPIAFAPSHTDFGLDADVPPDGLDDWLVVRASLTVGEAGTFAVSGNLWDSSGRYIVGATELAELAPGARTVDLRFPGRAIAEHGRDGPYTVSMTAGEFVDLNFTAYGTHVTRPYLARQFAFVSGQFLGPHSDQAVDSDVPADGLYDWLIFDVGVDVTRAGGFEVQIHLRGADARLIATGVNRTSLPVGRSVVGVAVDGRDIRERGVSGPYLVSLFLYDRHGAQIDEDFYVSRGYVAGDFQPPDQAAPDSKATLPSGHLWNTATVTVGYTAQDPYPSDGLASVTLYYRFSADNVMWSGWTVYDTRSVSGSSSSGSFAFVAPDGDGYYQFATVAADAAGNAEAAPIDPEAAAAVFVPARLEIITSSWTLPAGAQGTFQVRAINVAGRSTILSRPMDVSLISASPTGEFRSSASTTRIQSVTIPAGVSGAAFGYADATAGSATLIVAADGVAPGTATINITAVGIAVSSEVAVGLGGGAAAGLLAGVAVGWILWKRRTGQKPSAPPPPPDGSHPGASDRPEANGRQESVAGRGRS